MFEDNFDRLLGLHRLGAGEASEFLGISVTTLSYWRNGRREPTRDSLRRVCEFFDVPMVWLLAGSFQEILPDVERFERVELRIRGAVPEPSVPTWAGAGKLTVTDVQRRRVDEGLRDRASSVSPETDAVRKLRPVPEDT